MYGVIVHRATVRLYTRPTGNKDGVLFLSSARVEGAPNLSGFDLCTILTYSATLDNVGRRRQSSLEASKGELVDVCIHMYPHHSLGFVFEVLSTTTTTTKQEARYDTLGHDTIGHDSTQ